MATLDIFRANEAQFSKTGFLTPFVMLFAKIIQWNNARITRNALSKLSMRELQDIGLTPGDIDRISRQ